MSASQLELAAPAAATALLPDAAHRRVLEALEGEPTPAEYERLASIVRAPAVAERARPIRVAVLARDTLQPIRPFLQVRAFRSGLAAHAWFGPQGQLAEPILDPDGELHPFAADAIVLAGPPHGDFGVWEDGDPAEVEQRAAAAVRLQVELCRALRERSGALLLVHNFVVPLPRAGGQVCEVLRGANRELTRELAPVPDVAIVDVDALADRWGKGRMRDERLWHLGRIPLRYDLLPELAEAWLGPLRAWLGRSRKCLVLDCDNLLWGGVVGEVGLEGIALGPTYPGAVHLAIQREALALFERGIVLAVNSRNNPADALEVFERHPHALLRPEHIAAWQVNWDAKAVNMRRLASELGLGLEHLAFLDDDPRERALMRDVLPEVLTLEVAPDLGTLPARLARLTDFDVLAITSEDRRRGREYAARRLRRELEARAEDLESYYASLGTRVRLRAESPESRARVAQLLKKTNQFNLALRRHGERELEALRARGCEVWGLEVEDRFGDSGLSAVAILEPGQPAWRLESFLVSCRVLGRGVEQAFLAEMAGRARSLGAARLVAEFRPGPRNAPAREFLMRSGFAPLGAPGGDGRGARDNGGPAGAEGPGGEAGEGIELWSCDLAAGPAPAPPWIEVLR
ncbi:MAG: HAD-IIIC family phosphatase [Gemmatimonadota bacterium]